MEKTDIMYECRSFIRAYYLNNNLYDLECKINNILSSSRSAKTKSINIKDLIIAIEFHENIKPSTINNIVDQITAEIQSHLLLNIGEGNGKIIKFIKEYPSLLIDKFILGTTLKIIL